MFHHILKNFFLLLALESLDAQSPVPPICAPPGTRSGSLATFRASDDSLWRSDLPGIIVGEVWTVDGAPIAEAQVRVLAVTPKDSVVVEGLADKNGRFLYRRIRPGRYVLEVRRIGYLSQRHDLDMIPAGTDTLCIRMRVALRPVDPPTEGRDFLIRLMRERARESPLGDLATKRIAQGAFEFRVWGGFGLGGTRGLVLTRSARGAWAAFGVEVVYCSIVVPHSETLTVARIEALSHKARRECRREYASEGGQIISTDTLSIRSLRVPANPDSIWQRVLSAGLLMLPPFVARHWIMTDGYTFVLELRQGSEYRASMIESLEKPEHPADSVFRAVTDIFRRAYGWPHS